MGNHKRYYYNRRKGDQVKKITGEDILGFVSVIVLTAFFTTMIFHILSMRVIATTNSRTMENFKSEVLSGMAQQIQGMEDKYLKRRSEVYDNWGKEL
jgi:hypothetical protein